MQTIRYAKARLIRFEAVRVFTYSGGIFTSSYARRAGVTSLRRR